jgi:hypothetical protein
MGGCHTPYLNHHSKLHLQYNHDRLQHQQQQQLWLSTGDGNTTDHMQVLSAGSSQTFYSTERNSSGTDVQDFPATINLPLAAGPTHSSATGASAALQPSSSPSGTSPGPGGSSHTSSSIRWQKAKASIPVFVLNNFMLLSFSLAAALAMAWPLPGRVVASWSIGDVRVVQAVNNFLVFLISGLTLKSDDFR